MLDPNDKLALPQEGGLPKGTQLTPRGTSRTGTEPPHEGAIKLVGHRVSEGPNGELRVETQVTFEGRTFTGNASGPAALPDRLKVPALATLRALDECLQAFYLGDSHPALVLDDVIEISVGDFPVALVMITASERTDSMPVVASCPLVGMSDLSIILATLQATTRIVGRWLAWGDRSLPAGEPERPQ